MQAPKKEVQKERHSRSGISGSPKKGGAGGKGTWGVGGKDDLITSKLDPNDPNYISDEENEVMYEQVIVSSPIENLIHEYFLSGEPDEARKTLVEVCKPEYFDQFVKKALRFAMEKQSYERELISKVLLATYSNPIIPEQMERGFQLALDTLPDCKLDTPDAVEILGKFLARAIFDEIIPPAFFKHAHARNPLAEECLAYASGVVSEPHRSDRLTHIWGPGDLGSVKRLKEEATLVFDEYFNNADAAEADKSVRKLNAPSFHAQLVKQGIRLALQRGEAFVKKLNTLLTYFDKESLISPYHMKRGFSFCSESLPDIILDAPNAKTLFEELVKLGQEAKYLSEDIKL